MDNIFIERLGFNELAYSYLCCSSYKKVSEGILGRKLVKIQGQKKNEEGLPPLLNSFLKMEQSSPFTFEVSIIYVLNFVCF